MMDHAKEMGLGKSLPSDEAAQRQLYTTYLASAFRSLRFGLNDAHGKGMAIQFNYLTDKGAVVQHADGTFSVDMAKMKTAIADLDHDLLNRGRRQLCRREKDAGRTGRRASGGAKSARQFARDSDRHRADIRDC
jgi:hypothetical protein